MRVHLRDFSEFDNGSTVEIRIPIIKWKFRGELFW